jgi:hypothetical protein
MKKTLAQIWPLIPLCRPLGRDVCSSLLRPALIFLLTAATELTVAAFLLAESPFF